MNIHLSPTGDRIAEKTVQIDAPALRVWEALTNPPLMQKWMSETHIDIFTDWKVGNPIIIQGHLHSTKFQNKGTVLHFEPGKILRYSHLSSLSRLADEPRNYSIFEFLLAPLPEQTSLTLTLRNFPTESILKHLVFYWNVTLEILKKAIEKPG
ncbi:MAG: SRPBCC family protein [Bacteroidota bacterium]